ncbi:MAG: M48 family peptidase, partial [Burkholderiaceae bacterium]
MTVLRLLVVTLVSFALNAPPAHAQTLDLPSLGDAAGEELPPAMERRLGEQIMLQVRRDPTYLADPESTEYLTNLAYR